MQPDLVSLAGKIGETFAAESLDDLLLDYTRLFLGPYEMLAKPYGSCFLDGEKVVMGDSTVNARECYRAGGFEPDEEFREVPTMSRLNSSFFTCCRFAKRRLWPRKTTA